MEDKFKTILKIDELCKKNGVELILIKTPVYDESVYRKFKRVFQNVRNA